MPQRVNLFHNLLDIRQPTFHVKFQVFLDSFSGLYVQSMCCFIERLN